jgi:LacI family transcriptional regulator
MAVTMKDIAAATKVSLPTVSRVLNGKHASIGISDDLANRVRGAAARLGYRPNLAARAISTGRFNNVTLVLSRSPWRSSISSALIESIHDALADAQLHMSLARLSDEKLTDADRVPRFLREWSSDGLLVNYHVQTPDKLVELIDRHRLPSVWLNCPMEHDSVYPDDRGAGRLATEYLLGRGHRRILYVDSAYEWAESHGTKHYSKEHRLDGYRRAMWEAGCSPRSVLGHADYEMDLAAESCTWLVGDDRPTAAVCYSSHDARLIQLSMLAQGMAAGADLSLVTFGDPQYGPQPLRIDSLTVPDREVGQRGVEMLSQKIQTPEQTLDPAAIPFSWDTQNITCAAVAHSQ